MKTRSIRRARPAVPLLLSAFLAVWGTGPAVRAATPLEASLQPPGTAAQAPVGIAAEPALPRRHWTLSDLETTGTQVHNPFQDTLSDPIERFNRASYALNDALYSGILRPLGRGYKTILPEEARKRITKVGKNLAYPVRAVNNAVQGKMKETGEETSRFLVNTTVGGLGLYDPAAKMGMKPHEEDTGQSIGRYGRDPGSYVFLPLIGPTSERDAVGLPGDILLNPATYLGISPAFKFNDVTSNIRDIDALKEVEFDSYSVVRDMWHIARSGQVEDFDPEGKQWESNPDQTLESLFLDVKDKNFPAHGERAKARIAATGKSLPYNYWLQEDPAPLVYVLPGFGSHRFSQGALAVAEMYYDAGYSVVTVSNALNWEFMRYGSSVAMPGVTPIDAADTYNALSQIQSDLAAKHKGRITSASLVGVSLGGLHALHIADQISKGKGGSLKFDRVLAINPPVDLVYALQKLDNFYNAPLAWDPAERDRRIKESLYKAVAVANQDYKPTGPMPFDQTESKFLIGLRFRYELKDIIYNANEKKDMGVLEERPAPLKRDPVYREIMNYSFIDYLRQFVIPYYMEERGASLGADELLNSIHMWSIEDTLAHDPSVRVAVNKNDFLLQPGDVPWLEQVMGDRLMECEDGGHLGNLYKPEICDRLVNMLTAPGTAAPRRMVIMMKE